MCPVNFEVFRGYITSSLYGRGRPVPGYGPEPMAGVYSAQVTNLLCIAVPSMMDPTINNTIELDVSTTCAPSSGGCT